MPSGFHLYKLLPVSGGFQFYVDGVLQTTLTAGVPSGTLLLTIDQVDRTADGVAVLVSREHHLADAFTFTLLRRGPSDAGEEEH